MKITISDAQAGKRLDKLVVDAVPGLGRASAKRLFDHGRVRLFVAGGARGRRAAKGAVARTGDVLEIELDADVGVGAIADPEAPLHLVLERDDVLVLDKPAGQPTAPIVPGEKGTLVNALLARYPEVSGF